MVYIIAEAGVNHNGEVGIAKRLIDEAKNAGCDAVKFQAWTAGNLVTKKARKAEYQIKNTNNEETQYEMLKGLELKNSDHEELKKHCEMVGIEYLCSPFDVESVQMLKNLGLKKIKIPSGEITNKPLLREIGKGTWEIIMSTGMANEREIESAISVIEERVKHSITILHCTTEYPAPTEELNLNCIEELKKLFKRDIGYSDHTKGIHIAIAAVAIGATVIEKHITLDKRMEGPDHQASINPEEFQKMVEAIRDVESSFGDGRKKSGDAEWKNIKVARKSIVAKEEIREGDIYTENNLTTKRPGTGICPMRWDEIIGGKAKRSYNKDECIEI